MASITSSLRSSMLRGSRFQLRPLTRPAFTQAYLFHTSSPYRALKEEDRHRDTKEVSSEVEREKHEHLSKHKEGQAKWNNSLASSSEADVKADRGEVDSVETEQMEKEVRKARTIKETKGASK
ncbi:hypothetical protein TMEN_9339 [Trichophyton mentagrophytes]|uniref:Mitochondrial carrier protein pet8 n=2 Tax=Trichophyton interdigitale TaxID=101480 RepID=A0A9P4YNR8_9EURO|nr:hypothetical protein H101_00511 [Trichophyton interdigitale H6]KAF3900182.1 putative mitochondrial carrier protein pet8 [Trichophyton interdigitale]KDB23149.1 hypothetical protein H109_04964 [Trichophyton interdigitale MR816]GBF66619.1 hypothetical protein TMEN_9339 [Trichophyton mentagrophytes]KAF3901126.1 putative mitochondrial carrier protein pet8 [Trichophyton interdigitale]